MHEDREHEDREHEAPRGRPDLSVFFFSNADTAGADRYDSVLAVAELADRLGFTAVWLPERHFHVFGGLFPNPAVLAAAIAARTDRIGIRAGSVVVPLHHVLRIAEEWALVDALSGGRAGVSLASGWNQGDFVLARGAYEQRRADTVAAVDQLRALWRGEPIAVPGGDAPVRTYPAPARTELPLWLTATAGAATFEEAGRRGLNVLTAYIQQGAEELAGNIARYRSLFTGHTPGARPHVTVMLHTYVAATDRDAFAAVTEPLVRYQGDFLDLTARSAPSGAELTRAEQADLARYAATRYARDRGLIGGPDRITERLRHFASIGVDEIACLVDFGLPAAEVGAGLVRLAQIGLPVAAMAEPSQARP